MNAFLDAVSQRKFILVINFVANISKSVLGYVVGDMHIKPDPKHCNQKCFPDVIFGHCSPKPKIYQNLIVSLVNFVFDFISFTL